MLMHWVVVAALAAAGSAALWHYLHIDPVIAYLIAINVVAFVTYGYDKAVAGSNRSRVPERLLLALALVGGPVGALGGMQVFRHKTAKGSFRIRFWSIVLIEIAAIAAYFYYSR